jgi:hypothetical protein
MTSSRPIIEKVPDLGKRPEMVGGRASILAPFYAERHIVPYSIQHHIVQMNYDTIAYTFASHANSGSRPAHCVGTSLP